MSAISRGTKNVIRNPIRTFSVVIILSISLGLALVMFAALNAINGRIESVKSSIGNMVMVSPAGARGFLGGGEPLTTGQVDSLKSLDHVTSVDATIDAQLRPDQDTSLQSAMEAGTLGNRQFRAFGRMGQGAMTMPIFAIGTSNSSSAGQLIGSSVTVTAGQTLDAAADSDTALVGTALAEKNQLAAGSTFTAYGKTVTVTGVFDAGTHFANSAVVFPLKTLQRLSEQTDQVTSAVVHVDSVDDLASVTTAAKDKLGDAADVTSSEETVTQAVQPLENIRSIATTSLVGALIAAAVITLLTMVMVVRERRKEIAVLKALGAGDATIMTQFTTEALALSLLGSIVGSALGFVFSNPVLNALVSNSRGAGPGPGEPGRGMRIAFGSFAGFRTTLQNLAAVINLEVVAYGLLAAVIVAVIGSAFPAWLIGKIRPAEVLRNE
ncbi:MAG: ABC transporter permease [Candidatus Kerfeldbacteria bacterium]|nr:ABC transporter permease [Candidatus Kerfeldbacteria bacterium]